MNPQLKQKLLVETKVRYLNGESTQQISRSFGVTGETIRMQLQNMNIKRRTLSERNTKYSYNPNVFRTLTIESAYFAGLLMADGNITNKNKLLQIEINTKDKYLLDQFKNFLEYTGKIVPRTRIQKSGAVSELSALRITAPDIINDLIELYGIVPKKSKINDVKLGGIIKNSEFKEFFFRGLFDGDGCVHIRKNGSQFVSLAGSPNIVDSFRDFCQNKIREVGSLNKRTNRTHVVMFGSNKAVKIIKLLYSNKEGPRLWRKQNLIL